MVLRKDYFKLSKAELAEYEKYKFENRTHDENGNLIMPKSWSGDELDPNFIYKFDSLFPNHNINYLDILEDEDWFIKVYSYFEKLLNQTTISERDILNFIKINKGSFLISSVLQHTNFGHHERFIFPEFKLGDHFQVDFLIIGKASGGYQFLFVELENPYGQITTKKGEYSTVINKGLKQVGDWRRWIPKNFNAITQTLRKYKGPNKEFPKELYELDIDRLHFMVIGGRRNDYNELTYQIRREIEQERGSFKILHYDNVLDNAKKVIKTKAW